jgi:hypothetical protein
MAEPAEGSKCPHCGGTYQKKIITPYPRVTFTCGTAWNDTTPIGMKKEFTIQSRDCKNRVAANKPRPS